MDQVTQSTKIIDVNYLTKLVANDQGLSDTAAWALIKGNFVPKSEVLNIIEQTTRANQPGLGGQQQSRISELIAQKNDSSIEKFRLELEEKAEARRLEAEIRKIELEEKAEARRDIAESRRMELEEKKDAREQLRLETERKRLEIQEDYNRRKLEQEDKFKDEQIKIERDRQREDATLTKQMALAQKSQDIVREYYERLFKEREETDKKLMKLRDELGSKTPGDTLSEFSENQKKIIGITADILKTQGLDPSKLLKATNLNPEKEDGFIDKIIQIGGSYLKNRAPAQLTPEQTLEQQQQAAEQQRLAREREEKLRRDVDAEAARLTAEYASLEKEKARLKQIVETNKALQERYFEQRNILITKALDIGVPVNDAMNNEEIFMAIEKRDAEIEREHMIATQQREIERQKQAQAEAEAIAEIEIAEVTEAAKAEQVVKTSEITETPEITDITDTTDNIEPKIESEIIEPTVEMEQENLLDIKQDEIEAEEPEASQKEPPAGRKKKRTRTRSGIGKPNYIIYRDDDGTVLTKVKSNNHKNAGLKIAKTLDGTLENPVRIKVTDESGLDKYYDTYIVQIESRSGSGTTYSVPRVKAVRVKAAAVP